MVRRVADTPASSGAPAMERIYFLDAARALLMILGIPYHAAVLYVVAPAWSGGGKISLDLLYCLTAIIHSFRMPAFFIIAGFFAALMLGRRSPAEWFRGRLMRLGIPLLTSLFLFSPAEIYLRHWTGQPLPSDWDSFYALWLSYLWFLPELILLSFITALCWHHFTARPALHLGRLLDNIALHERAIGLIGAAIGCWMVFLQSYHMLIGFDLSFFQGFIDIHRSLQYAPYFALGIAACLDSRLRQKLSQTDPLSLAVGFTALIIYAATWEDETRTQIIASRFSGAIAAICIAQALFALLARTLDHPNQRVRKLVDASFTIYLLHYPLVALFAVILSGTGMPLLIKWLLVSSATFYLSYLGHRLVMRQPLLLFLLNGVNSKPQLAAQSGRMVPGD